MKRLFDFVFAFLAIIFLSPVIVLVALVVWKTLGFPFLFRQIRVGKNGKTFKMVKFKSMLDIKDENGNYLPDSMRLTKFGKWLRSSSLDELPELWNVLRGDMSIVGPRPLLYEYLPLYSKEQHRRHEVRPGITGLAQINGRNAITWVEKFTLDVRYVDNQSFFLDIKILILTFKNVIKKQGISADGEDTMPKFTGNE